MSSPPQRRSDYANYGYDELIDHNSRYERLEEFVDVVEPSGTAWIPTRSSGTA